MVNILQQVNFTFGNARLCLKLKISQEMLLMLICFQEVGFDAVETLRMGLSKEGEKFYSRSEVDQSFSHVFIFETSK